MSLQPSAGPLWDQILPGWPTGPQFDQIGYNHWLGKAEGQRCGIGIAARNPRKHQFHLLNQADLHRVIDALDRTDKHRIDVGYIIAAIRKDAVRDPRYVAHREIRDLLKDLQGIPPMTPSSAMEHLGPFWLLTSALKPTGRAGVVDYDDDDDTF
jgi:hypothetical protein